MGILTKDKTRLQLFESGIRVNKKLPKHVIIQEHKKKEASKLINHLDSIKIDTENTNLLSHPNYESSLTYALKDNIDYDTIARLGIEDLNNYLADHNLQENLFGYGSYSKFTNSIDSSNLYDRSLTSFLKKDSKEEKGIFKRLVSFLEEELKTRKEKKEDFDVLGFFNDVKFASQESVDKYKNRVENYLIAIHQACEVGQTARIEQLMKNLIFNKYDAILNSIGYHMVITEEQVVEFSKKVPKGLSLTYIENYIKVIPREIMDKITELNKYLIFDNYVILHYDPQQKAYKETEQQKAKRKDPILFGVCCGCNKLYYIGDWIDETCDLTLDQFVDTLGIKKDKLEKTDFTV